MPVAVEIRGSLRRDVGAELTRVDTDSVAERFEMGDGDPKSVAWAAARRISEDRDRDRDRARAEHRDAAVALRGEWVGDRGPADLGDVTCRLLSRAPTRPRSPRPTNYNLNFTKYNQECENYGAVAPAPTRWKV